MPTIYSDDDDRRPRDAGPKKALRSSTGVPYGLLAGAFAAVVLAMIFIYAMQYRVRVKPAQDYRVNAREITVVRDALWDLDKDVDPVPDMFKPEDRVLYEREGRGFTVNFRIDNDPTNGYNTTTFSCGVKPWERYYETSASPRKKDVARWEKEFLGDKCLGRYLAPLPAEMTLEIGLDDTEGVSDKLKKYVEETLAGQVDLDNDLVHPSHVTHLLFFRISQGEGRNQKSWDIRPDADLAAAKAKWFEGLAWLTEDRGKTEVSSIAAGLFNILDRYTAVHRRRIIVFSDGMENSPNTVSFYTELHNRRFLDEAQWPELQKRITANGNDCPSLQYANVTWFMHLPGAEGLHFRQVKRFWTDTLKNVCKAKAPDVNY
jgi:hypothetical protein